MTEKIYIGTKIVAAEPMGSAEFSKTVRDLPGMMLGGPGYSEPGYRVRYEDGYVSWSPKGVFERCYREVSDHEQSLMSFDGEKFPAPSPGSAGSPERKAEQQGKNERATRMVEALKRVYQVTDLDRVMKREQSDSGRLLRRHFAHIRTVMGGILGRELVKELRDNVE